jgi:2-polyprenyl-3-methyl-5-hydroxy-6-metoxy-1,4-benzoquinol methylase
VSTQHDPSARVPAAAPVPAPVEDVAWLSDYARRRKLEWFFAAVPKDAAILDVGCADGWVGRWLRARGYDSVTGIDLEPPADHVGDVNDWRALGLPAQGFDVIVAFEVVEHADLADALHDLLKPGGRLFATTPVPRLDWACRAMERVGMLQKRTSPHTHLVDLRRYPRFRAVDRTVKGFVSQWGVLAPL